MTDALISRSTSLEDFFRQRVEDVVARHGIDDAQETRWYLVRLLCDYSRSSRFHDEGTAATLVPLAEYYGRALEAGSHGERRLHLRRLGDVALFVASLFGGALARRPVDVGYYISMGGGAYAALADESAPSARDRALADVFAALAARFEDYVTALSEIPERRAPQESLLEEIDRWEATRHPALARRLRERGVFLADDETPLH